MNRHKSQERVPSFTKALGIVALFWWTVFFLLGLSQNNAINATSHASGIGLVMELTGPFQLLGLEFFVAFICIAAAIGSVLKARHHQWLTLGEDEHYGLHSNMGRIESCLMDPSGQQQPSQALEDRLIGSLSGPFSELILKFIEQTKLTEPAIASAMRSCLAVLCQYPDFPASSHTGGSPNLASNSTTPDTEVSSDTKVIPDIHENHHGQCTLLEHSLRVAAFAILERENFIYQGLQTDLRILIGANPNFHFDAQDPLPILLALVHDIGKLQTFKLNAQFQVYRVKGHHGPVGALLLAQLACIKRLNARQRHVLYKGLSHYHNPYHFTVPRFNELDDDYTVANMMLLIKADKRAGLAERRGFLSKSDASFFEQFLKA